MFGSYTRRIGWQPTWQGLRREASNVDAPRRAEKGELMRAFGDLEAAVMSVLWDRGEPLTVRDALASLKPGRELAYTTVLTVMDNLHRKGQLDREMKGRAWLYRPVRTRVEHAAACLHGVLDEYEDRHEVLMRFVADLDSDSVAQLRHAVEAARKRNRYKDDLADRTSSHASQLRQSC